MGVIASLAVSFVARWISRGAAVGSLLDDTAPSVTVKEVSSPGQFGGNRIDHRVMLGSWGGGPPRAFKLISQRPSVSDAQASSLLDARGRACYGSDSSGALIRHNNNKKKKSSNNGGGGEGRESVEPVANGTVVFRKAPSSGAGLVQVGVWTSAASSSTTLSSAAGARPSLTPGPGQYGKRCHMLWIERLSHPDAAEAAAAAAAEQKERENALDDAEKHMRLGMEKAAALLIHLPNSRKHEHEADLIGLKLAAVAGYPLRAGIDAINALDGYDERERQGPRGEQGVVGALATRMVRKCAAMFCGVPV